MKKSELQHRDTNELVPFAGNARTHSEQQIDQICESIQKFGFYNPVLIDESGIIIAGHGRIMAAKKLGLTTVPTMVIFDLTEMERRTLTLADNKISLNSSWDMEKVREELSLLAESDLDLDLTGFHDFEIESLLRDDLDILPPNVMTSFVEVVNNSDEPDVEDESDIEGSCSESEHSESNETKNSVVAMKFLFNSEDADKVSKVLNALALEFDFKSNEPAVMHVFDFYINNK